MRDFDITIETKVRVLPREVPGTVTEKWKWEALERSADLQFRKIAHSMKTYLQDQVQEEIMFRENTQK